MRIGVIGAGKLGTVLARRAVGAGHEVVIAGRPGARQTALMVEVMAPGATPLPVEDWPPVDIAILAVPLNVALRFDLPLPAGTAIVDATNHWPPVDGDLPELHGRSSSEAVAERHAHLRWVKSLNHLGYHDYEADPAETPFPPAIGVASDDPAAASAAAELIDSLGFDPVRVGSLSRGRLLETGGPVFSGPLHAERLRAIAAAADAAQAAHRPAHEGAWSA